MVNWERCVSDPLPPALQAALPLYQGESGAVDFANLLSPLKRGRAAPRSARGRGSLMTNCLLCLLRESAFHGFFFLEAPVQGRNNLPAFDLRAMECAFTGFGRFVKALPVVAA